MDFDTFYSFALSLPYVVVETPFGPDTLVFKVGGKVFLLCGIDEMVSFNVKCDPDYALSLREEYRGVVPGFHMNKKHWNTVKFSEDVSWSLMQQLIKHSYDLVYSSLTKKLKSEMPL